MNTIPTATPPTDSGSSGQSTPTHSPTGGSLYDQAAPGGQPAPGPDGQPQAAPDGQPAPGPDGQPQAAPDGPIDPASVKIPGANATPEEVKAFHQALGVPDTPEGYEFTDPGFKPEDGLTFSPELSQWAAKQFHELGIPKEAGKKLFDNWNALQAESVKQQRAAYEQMGQETMAKLRAEYADDASFSQAMKDMHVFVSEFGGKELDELLRDPAVGNNAVVLRTCIKAGERFRKAMGETPILGGDNSNSLGGNNEQGLRNEIEKIKNDESGPYWNASHPEHKATVERVRNMYKALTDMKKKV